MLGTDGGGVTGALLTNTVDGTTREVEATGIFLAIGHTPNTQFLRGQLKLTAKKYIQWTVPFRTNTSVDGVLPPATWPTIIIGRRSRRPARAARRRSTPSAGCRITDY